MEAAKRRRPRAEITAECRPVLPRYVTLRHDPARERWVLLVPERVLLPDETAIAILRLCDGERRVADIVDELAAQYAADPAVILADAVALLQELADTGFMDTRTETAP